ncbi:MAG: alpha-L-rhamnosidase C-terminal domain-containing protein, partial [Arthrobacter sp.]
YTAGLRQAPGGAGWDRVVIEPRPGAGLTSASTSHHGPHGLIDVQWAVTEGNADDGGLTLTATIPTGTTAEVLLPGRPAAVVGPGHHTFLAAPGGDSTQPELMRSTL